METLTIRPAILADFDAICALIERVDRLHADALPDVYQLAEKPARTYEWFAQISKSPDSCMFVAECQGVIAGMILCTVRSSPAFPLFVPRRYGHINELVVSESFQGQGIGRRLVQRVHEWVQDQGITEIELDVYEFNGPARTLYEHLGYETMRRTMRHRLSQV